MKNVTTEIFDKTIELRKDFCLLAIEYAVMKREQGWNLERIKQGYLELVNPLSTDKTKG